LDHGRTRQEQRERKQLKRRAKIPQHGRHLARAYRDAILKRARQLRRKGTG
jgi:hypothetical protein